MLHALEVPGRFQLSEVSHPAVQDGCSDLQANLLLTMPEALARNDWEQGQEPGEGRS